MTPWVWIDNPHAELYVLVDKHQPQGLYETLVSSLCLAIKMMSTNQPLCPPLHVAALHGAATDQHLMIFPCYLSNSYSSFSVEDCMFAAKQSLKAWCNMQLKLSAVSYAAHVSSVTRWQDTCNRKTLLLAPSHSGPCCQSFHLSLLLWTE